MWYKKTMRKEQLEAQIEKAKAELLKLGPMRPGSLSQQYSTCQKPGCKCVDPVHPQKHGPFYQLSYTHGGKSTTQFVRPQFVPEVRMQHASYKKFKALTQQWVTLALEFCKLEMQKARSAAPASGDDPPVLSFHLPGENSRIGPPFVFPHQDWLLVHFLHIFAAKNRST